MRPESYYQRGTVTVRHGSPIVTGENTLWLTGTPEYARPQAGTIFTVDKAHYYQIISVDSETQLTLEFDYAANDSDNVSYIVLTDAMVDPTSPEGVDMVTLLQRAIDAATDSEASAVLSGQEADRATTEADRAKAEADRSELEANRSSTEADRAGQYVTDVQSEADRAKTEADRAKTEADRSQAEADRSALEADRAEAAATTATDAAANTVVSETNAKDSETKAKGSENAAANSAAAAKASEDKAEELAGQVEAGVAGFKITDRGDWQSTAELVELNFETDIHPILQPLLDSGYYITSASVAADPAKGTTKALRPYSIGNNGLAMAFMQLPAVAVDTQITIRIKSSAEGSDRFYVDVNGSNKITKGGNTDSQQYVDKTFTLPANTKVSDMSFLYLKDGSVAQYSDAHFISSITLPINKGAIYQVGDRVRHNDRYWICGVPNASTEPFDGNVEWFPSDDQEIIVGGEFKGEYEQGVKQTECTFDGEVYPIFQPAFDAGWDAASQMTDPVNDRYLTLRSLYIGNGGSTYFDIVVNAQEDARTFKLRYMISTEGSDTFYVNVNGSRILTRSNRPVGWQNFEYQLPLGECTIRFGRTMDGSVAAYHNRVFISSVEIPLVSASGNYLERDVVSYLGTKYMTLVDKPTSLPDSGSDEWVSFGGGGGTSSSSDLLMIDGCAISTIGDNEVIFQHITSIPFTLKSSLVNHKVYAKVAPLLDATFEIVKTGVVVGTMTILSGANEGTVVISNDEDFVLNDILEVRFVGAQDASLETVSFNLIGVIS